MSSYSKAMRGYSSTRLRERGEGIQGRKKGWILRVVSAGCGENAFGGDEWVMIMKRSRKAREVDAKGWKTNEQERPRVNYTEETRKDCMKTTDGEFRTQHDARARSTGERRERKEVTAD